MKKTLSQCLCLAVMTVPAAAAVHAPSPILRAAEPAPATDCRDNMERDSMETVPATDDPAPVLLPASDAGCKVPQAPISA